MNSKITWRVLARLAVAATVAALATAVAVPVAATTVDADGVPEVRLSPSVRLEPLESVSTLPFRVIAPFLTESVIVDEQALAHAPRIIAAVDGRTLMQEGDRVYAREDAVQGGDAGRSVLDGRVKRLRVFRQAEPLRHPVTHEVLGFEARFVGDAELVTPVGESIGNSEKTVEPVPATLFIRRASEEVRVGDRLLAQPPVDFVADASKAPVDPAFAATVVALHGDAAVMAGAGQVVVLDKGNANGLERGHWLAVLSEGKRIMDTSAMQRDHIRLPDEPNATLMVFRVFERLSYALIVDAELPVAVGDRIVAAAP